MQQVVSQGQLTQSTAEISSGQTTSGTITTNGASLCGIEMPSAFTGSSLTFLAGASSSGPFYPVYNSSGQVSYSVSASRYVAINPQDFYGILFLQIVSSSSEGANRALVCSMKGI